MGCVQGGAEGVGLDRLIWRGEVYDIDLGNPVGRKPALVRPAVIVSTDLFNNGPGALVIVVPVGSVGYGLRSHIGLEPGLSGLNYRSYARCDQIRVVSTERILMQRGITEADQLHAIDEALRFILDL